MAKTVIAIRDCRWRRRDQEFIKFLNTITEVPKATAPPTSKSTSCWTTSHNTPAVRGWLRRYPEHHFHFTPTSASWINQAE